MAHYIASLTAEVREAQRVCGLEHSVFAVAVATIVRTLTLAHEIAYAIDARRYDSGSKRTWHTGPSESVLDLHRPEG